MEAILSARYGIGLFLQANGPGRISVRAHWLKRKEREGIGDLSGGIALVVGPPLAKVALKELLHAAVAVIAAGIVRR